MTYFFGVVFLLQIAAHLVVIGLDGLLDPFLVSDPGSLPTGLRLVALLSTAVLIFPQIWCLKLTVCTRKSWVKGCALSLVFGGLVIAAQCVATKALIGAYIFDYPGEVFVFLGLTALFLLNLGLSVVAVAVAHQASLKFPAECKRPGRLMVVTAITGTIILLAYAVVPPLLHNVFRQLWTAASF